MRRLFGFSLPSFFRLACFSLLFLSPLASADCPRLERVDIAANDILDEAASRRITTPFLGNCIDVALTRALLAAISQDLITRGFITSRPYLLEQDISDGQLEIELLVGRIEAVVDADSGARNASIGSAFLFRSEILNLRELESALEVIERPSSVSTSFAILPGTREGASIVEITTRRAKPLRLELGANAQTDLDSQLSLHALLDNPFRINDILELRVNSGDVLESYQSNDSSELRYSFALGDYLLSLSRSEISYEQRIQGIDGSFLSEGETRSEIFSIAKTLTRGQAGKLSARLLLELSDTDNFFEDTRIDVSSYKTSQLQLQLQHDWLQQWGQLSGNLAYHRGLDKFGARDDDYFTREGGAESDARLQFSKYTLGAQLYYYLAAPAWRLDLNFHLQYSEDTLFDNDKLNLGSPFTVRGYSSALSGANGWYLHCDILHLLQAPRNPAGDAEADKSIALSAGLDYGDIECESDNPDSCGEIYGAALGLVARDANFSARLSWGHPLKEFGDDIGRKDRYFLDLRWAL